MHPAQGYFLEGEIHWLEPETKTSEYCWEILGEYPVTELNGTLYYQVLMDGQKWNFQLPWIGQQSDIMCIKGKSDSEEQYYLQYFKVKTLS